MSGSISIVIPKEYAFVAAAAISTGFLTQYQAQVTGKWRKLSGVKYPLAYADAAVQKENQNAFKFNCAQRAHANTIEHMPTFLIALMWTGLRYPLTAAALGAAWTIGRIFYTMGYVSSNPQKRYRGAFHSIAEHVLYLLGLYSTWELYTGKW